MLPPPPALPLPHSVPFHSLLPYLLQLGLLFLFDGRGGQNRFLVQTSIGSDPKLSQCYTWTNTVTLAVSQYCVHTCD